MVRPTRIIDSPQIDGIVEDKEWGKATVISDFVQRLPKEGGEPFEKTIVYLMYTKTDLFVAMRAYDSKPEGITATVMKRDDFEITKNDQFALAIDTYNDGRNGYWFSTNPLGARVDAQFSNEGDIWESNWDGIWECDAHVDSTGWSMEMRIPFSTIRFNLASENIMGINLFRRIIRTNEWLFSPLIPLQYANGTPNVSVSRKYVFEGITGGNSFFIKPYVLGGSVNTDLQRSRTAETKSDFGLDLRYNFTDNLTANASFNIDFAQAEADEKIINLTRFNVLLPEKRDFFLENASYFSFGLPGETEVFTSRRIGLVRDSMGNFNSVPTLLGAKITGKISGIDLGIFNVQTKASSISSAENFGVARFKADIAPRSYWGGIFTNRSSTQGSYARSFGLDFLVFMYDDIAVSGFGATAVSNSNPKIGTNLSSYHLAIFQGGERTSFNVGVQKIGALFDPGMGFVQIAGVTKWNAKMGLPWYLDSQLLRRVILATENVYLSDDNGDLFSSSNQVSFQFDFHSDDQVTLFGRRWFEFLRFPFQVFRSSTVLPGKYTAFDAGVIVATKPGRPLSTTVSLTSGEFFDGTRFENSLTVVWKINRYITLSQAYLISDVKLSNSSFRASLLRSRVDYSLNTRFSIAALLQYDNASQQLALNVRTGYIFSEGTQVFFVYNEIDEGSSFASVLREGNPLSRAMLLKMTYLLSF